MNSRIQRWEDKLKEHSCKEQEFSRIEKEFRKEFPRDYSSNDYYNKCINPRNNAWKELRDWFEMEGIVFDCEDTGGEHCLNTSGLIHIIKILRKN